MAFSTGTSSGTAAEINVTPLIDILLVLLIIFMVVVPITPRGLSALLPQPSKSRTEAAPEQPLVVQVHSQPGGGIRYELNRKPVSGPDLAKQLGQALQVREDKVLFVRGDRDLQFSSVAEVIALALGHAANANRIGVLTPGADATP